jgi:hypothetical protein
MDPGCVVVTSESDPEPTSHCFNKTLAFCHVVSWSMLVMQLRVLMHVAGMSMRLRYLQSVLIIFVLALGLAGCGRTESYRYKLTLAVNTPDGVKRGSTVVEVLFYDVSIPARGTMHKLYGQALYLDLGPNTKPLVALLTNRLHGPYDNELRRLNELGLRWSDEVGPSVDLMLRLYGLSPSSDYVDDIPRIAAMRGPRKISISDLPNLVTFADTKDPATVIKVDPDNLQATLGAGISWNEITLESTGEPITKGIVLKLPWLQAYVHKNLDGSTYGGKRDIANILNGWYDFDQSGELKIN